MNPITIDPWAILRHVVVTAALGDICSGARAAPFAGDAVFQPWQQGRNDDAVTRGLEFTVPQVDALADFHGDVTAPKLVPFVGGNYFFAMAPLVKEFEKENPLIPWPHFLGNHPAEASCTANESERHDYGREHDLDSQAQCVFCRPWKGQGTDRRRRTGGSSCPHVTNQPTIIVRQGNPKNVQSLNNLANPAIRLSMPNPEFEGAVQQIRASLVKAGGDALELTVYNDKIKAGTTVLTHIPHRQTALFLMQDRADANVVWKSEAILQEQPGHPVSHVDIPAAPNTTATCAGPLVHSAEHVEAATKWLTFNRSPAALGIFERFGFREYEASAAH